MTTAGRCERGKRMTMANNQNILENRIGQWRTYLRGRQPSHVSSDDDLETRLRAELAALQAAGLSTDEAFFIALRRIGSGDEPTREFVQAHTDLLWEHPVQDPSSTPTPEDYGKPLSLLDRAFGVIAPDPLAGGTRGKSESPVVPQGRGESVWTEGSIVFTLAVIAGLSIKIPDLFGVSLFSSDAPEWVLTLYLKSLIPFVLALLTIYFVWKRGLSKTLSFGLVAVFAASVVFANALPFDARSDTELLSAGHLPILLGLAVGVAYAGNRWTSVDGRMDFVRFSGELFIYYVLIALGGGVFSAFTIVMFDIIQIDVTTLILEWMLPCGALGAVLVAAWLVEARQRVMGNILPMLARIFTPLFAVMLLILLVAMLGTGRWWTNIEREILLAFNLLLALILGLLLYSVSSRSSHSSPDIFDATQLILVVSALAVDILALTAIAGRISEFGFTPNRTAVLGMNLILLVNLAWSAWLYARFLLGYGPFAALERWQTSYAPVYAAWAATVIVIFPPLFRFA